MYVNLLSSKKSKVKVTLSQSASRLSASPSLITFQFHPLVVLLSDIAAGTCFHELISTHLALKGLMYVF